MKNKLSELKEMIQGAIDANPGKMRVKALKACQWRLRGPVGQFVGLGGQFGFTCAFVPESKALIFDGRDNEEMKLAAYQSTLGELTFEIIPQIVCAS